MGDLRVRSRAMVGLGVAGKLADQSTDWSGGPIGRLVQLSTLTRGRALCKVDPDVDVVPSWHCRSQGFAGWGADRFGRCPYVQRGDRGRIDAVEHGQDADEL